MFFRAFVNGFQTFLMAVRDEKSILLLWPVHAGVCTHAHSCDESVARHYSRSVTCSGIVYSVAFKIIMLAMTY